jgi:phage terminase large subunit
VIHDVDSKAFQFWKQNPVRAVVDWFGATPTDYQAKIIADIFGGEPRTAVKSAHGVGKTTLNAWAGIIMLMTRKFPRVVMTAPVQAQLTDVLIPEYAKWIERMPEEWSKLFSVSATHIRYKPHPNSWFAVARTSNKPANLQGFHGQHIMIQADEASAIEEPVFQVIEGALSEAEENDTECLLFMTGNPNFTAGELYNAFTKNKELYNRFTICGDPEAKPRPEDGQFYLSSRVSKKYRLNMEKKYGKESAIWDVRVAGQFPRSADDVVIPYEWAKRAAGRALPHYDDVADGVTIIVDPARYGGNETVMSTFRKGCEIRKQARPKTSSEAVADMIADEKRFWEAQRIRVDQVIMDEPGIGGPIIDICKRRGIPITSYHGGQALNPDRDPAEDCRMFANRRARDWWHARRLFELNVPSILEDDTTVNQLASVKFFYNESDKIQVESKKKMVERLGEDASPDRADTIVMALSPWYSLISTGNTAVTMDQVILGADRPQYSLEMF